MTLEGGAPALLRAVGLLPDGPVIWGRPLTTRSAGVYLVELAEPAPTAPLENQRIGRWIERLPELRLAGERPTARSLMARLASLWLPNESVVYLGGTRRSVGGRTLALARHVLGDRHPHADGQWLHAVVGIERARIWWAETDAVEEYLDALFDAFAESAATRTGDQGGLIDGRPEAALLLPWANTRRATGDRQAHGITGAIAADETPTAPPTRVVAMPPGDADGARADDRGTGTTRRGPRSTTATASRTTAARSPAARRTPAGPRHASDAAAAARAARTEPIPMTAEAMARLDAELQVMTQSQRPEVVARIKAAREHGDLKENAEYQAAREEQSFLEGRVRLLEERKRNSVLIKEIVTGRVSLGSVVDVEIDGDAATYTIVGTTDADPAAGRISSASPVGAALIGAVRGTSVRVRTPRGEATYVVVDVR
ncbi:MAG: transcription elongation factor GreA [Candidatus Limnocylindrales bacterium]